MYHLKRFLSGSVLLVLSIIILITSSGCDFSARGDLKRAEKAMNNADAWKAENWAEREYRKAQAAFDEAIALNAERKVNEARDMAQKAKEWADEASALAEKRQEEMQAEQDKLGAYK